MTPVDPTVDSCAEAGLDCGLYHQLSPVLHELGFFLSYERYPHIVRRAFLSSTREATKTALVAGIESEWSARAFLDAIGPLVDESAVTFVDRCPTPLRRAEALLSAPNVLTRLVDIEDPASVAALGVFDLVVGDSFIKQFPRERKRSAIAALATLTRPGGLVVLREYLGDLPQLLGDFWGQLPERLSSTGRLDLVALVESLGGAAALARLHRYMDDIGSTHADEATLLDDLTAAGLSDHRIERPAGKPYVIVVAMRKDPSRQDISP